MIVRANMIVLTQLLQLQSQLLIGWLLKTIWKKGSALWYFALTLIENEVRRDIFMNIEDDNGRKYWLMYMQANQK